MIKRNIKYSLPQSEGEFIPDTSGGPVNFVFEPGSLSALKGDKVLSCFLKSESPIEIDKLSKQTTPCKEISLPMFKFPVRQRLQDHIISLQKWQGYVIKIQNGSLLVRLIDLTESGPEEEAEIPLEELSEDDKELIKPGAVFYWNIGYKDSFTGQRTRISIIRFQRLPKWSKEDIDAAIQRADSLQKIITWE